LIPNKKSFPEKESIKKTKTRINEESSERNKEL
jgi:hypothetical protein